LSEFGDVLGGHDRANRKAVIERVWRYTGRPRSSDFGDALGGRTRARVGIHFGGGDQARLDEYLDAVDGWRTRC